MDESTFPKIYATLKKKNPKTMFFIARSDSTILINYEALVHGRNLHNNVAHIVNHKIEDASDCGPVHPVLVENLFGFNKPKRQGEYYVSTIKAMPERVLQIKLSKNTGGASVYTTIDGSENCKLVGVFLDMDMSSMIPSLHKLMLMGVSKVTKSYVTEEIKVTPQMIHKFDVKQLLSSYITTSTA